MIYNKEAESAVLGTILLYENAIYEVADMLPADAFFDPFNKFIYECIMDIANDSKVDLVTVTELAMSRYKTVLDEQYHDMPIAYHISELTMTTHNASHLTAHAQILLKYLTKRRLAEMSNKIRQDIDSDKNVDEILSEAADVFMEATSTKKRTEVHVSIAIDEFLANQKKDLTEKLLSTYVPEVDGIIGGFEYSDLVIIAGAASMGKTSFMLKLLQNHIKHDKSVAIMSLEMSNNQLLTRLVSMETEIKVKKIRYNDLDGVDWGKINNVIDKYREKSFHLDSETVQLSDVLNKLRKLKIKHDIDIVYIDYLQLIQDGKSKGNREQEVARIARSLKNIAKELNIVVVALSQLSRAVNNRDSKRPTLGDLRESGEIEQAADTVILMYREEYYDMENAREVQDADAIIAKGRNAGTGTASILFRPDIVKFISPSEQESAYNFVPNPDFGF